MQRSFHLIQTAGRIHRDAVLEQVSSVRAQSVQCSVESSVTHSPGDEQFNKQASQISPGGVFSF